MTRKASGIAPDWLVRRPVAHRGLHNLAAGRIENSLSAAMAAIDGGFAIEADLQLTADGDAVVFHDDTLDRLTGSSGPVAALPALALTRTVLRGSGECIPDMAAFMALIAGRVPLICEIKSRFDGDLRLAERAAALASSYGGPIALKSFDPTVIRHLRALRCEVPLGIVAEARYDDAEWAELSPALKRDLAEVLHFGDTRPDFLSYAVDDLPHAVPHLCRIALRLPVMCWTVRTAEQRQVASVWADQMVFEGFEP